jgi:dipeptidyl aminopeptidase/acylaminoacyl peptidase
MRRSGHRMYARRRRRTGRVVGVLLVLAGVAALVGAGATLIPSWLGSGPSMGTPTPAPKAPACPTARVAGRTRLGAVAWVRDGVLSLLELESCKERTLVQTGAAPPVRFSHDGRWIAFGEGTIVRAAGGAVQSPLGGLRTWQWSPSTNLLAGVTPGGGVAVGGPAEAPRMLLPDGTQTGHLAFSPNGRSLAIDVGGDRVEVVDVADGSTATIYRVTPGTKASPEVAAWSPDGRWVLFFSRFPGKAAIPLNAAPAKGGAWANVFDPVLPYGDFLSGCGDQLVLSGGAKRVPSEGNQILLSGPPQWRFHNLSVDFSRSWIWPSCSPNGRWVVATATPNRPETPPGYGVRSVWLLSTDGTRRARLKGAAKTAYELPRWSEDGRFLLIVRRDTQPDSPGVLLLIPIDPSSGKTGKTVGPVARLGPAPGEEGHGDWSLMSDWYRPGRDHR